MTRMTKSCRNSACVCMSFPRVSITAKMRPPPPKFLLFKTYFFQVVQRSHYKRRCRRPGPMYERSEEGELQFSSFSSLTITTVWHKSQTGCLILYYKRPNWRVGVWPIWVGPAHCPFGQSIIHASMVRDQKMSNFCPVV